LAFALWNPGPWIFKLQPTTDHQPPRSPTHAPGDVPLRTEAEPAGDRAGPGDLPEVPGTGEDPPRPAEGRAGRRVHPVQLPGRAPAEGPRRRGDRYHPAGRQVPRLRPDRPGALGGEVGIGFGVREGEGVRAGDADRGDEPRRPRRTGSLGRVAP